MKNWKNWFKLGCIYTLCGAGGHGAGIVLRDSINEKKPVKVFFASILCIATCLGAYWGADTFGEKMLNEEDEEEEDKI